MCTLVPTLLLLCNADGAGAAHRFAVTQLVSLASTQAGAFKVAAGALDAERRSLLEGSVRRALQGQMAGAGAAARGQDKVNKGIELRSFG